MNKKNYTFLIMTICMSIICIVRAAGTKTDFSEFWQMIAFGIAGFAMGFLFFGIMMIVMGVFFKIIFGNTKIYIVFKKMVFFSLILWFIVSLTIFLTTFMYSGNGGNAFE